MIFLSWLNATKNLWLVGAIIGLCVAIFIGGIHYDRHKNAAEVAEVNIPLAELKGKDEAEVAAEAQASKVSDAVVSGAVKQSCPLTEETARLMASIK